CRKLWEQRDAKIRDFRERQPSPEEEERFGNDFLDLVIFWTKLRVKMSPGDRADDGHRESLQALAEAERLFGPHTVLLLERGDHEEALGRKKDAGNAGQSVASLAVCTPWEHY